MQVPKWSAPMLATLSYDHFSDPAWIYERKLDGMRCLLHKQGNTITLLSRNKKIQNACFPELVTALKKYRGNFVLDSEIVTFDKKQTSFEKLQQRMHVQNPSASLIKKVPIVAYVFDILYLNDLDLCGLPLLQRKRILQQQFKFTAPLKLLAFKKQHGEKYLQQACKAGWEGLIAKLANSRYEHKRSKSWLKFKCAQGQEMVIGGFTLPQGGRINFGALLLGYYQNGKLRYAGKVGTGFDEDLLRLLYGKMLKLKRDSSPFIDCKERTKNILWLEPKLVAEIRFTEWTSDGKLRHPSFIGLRTDKNAKKVVRE